MEPKRRRNAHAPQRQKGGAKYVRTMLVIGRTMLVMGTPYTSPSKACVWCCYHGGHATTLNCHAYVLFVGIAARPLSWHALHPIACLYASPHRVRRSPRFWLRLKQPGPLLLAQAKAAWPLRFEGSRSPKLFSPGESRLAAHF